MRFIFIAKNLEDSIVNGYVTAVTRDEAVKILQNKELSVISLNEEKSDSGLNISIDKYVNVGGLFDHVSLKDIVNISKQMSALLEAGVSVVKALQLISEDIKKPHLKKVFEIIIQDVKSGKSISTAFGRHKDIFSDFYINLVKSGEESGKMAQAFSYLSDYMDRNYALMVKVRNAMIYPGFVIATFFIVMILVFTMVIPRLAEILNDSNVELPALTQAVLAISNFLINYGVYFGVFLAMIIIYAFMTMRNTQGWNILFDTLKIKFPIIRNIFKTLYVTRIADNIQTLLTSGVSITKAIQITGDVVGNVYYKQVLDQALVDVKGGMPISTSFAKHKELIPSTLSQMLKIGEETGEIGKLMGNIAKYYQRELNTTIDTMVGLIEPLMIVLLGLGVGVLLVSVLMPIYNLAGSF
jgi:type IV pilus assembly protein PilC